MLVLNAFLTISEGLVSDNQSWNIFLPHLTFAKISPIFIRRFEQPAALLV